MPKNNRFVVSTSMFPGVPTLNIANIGTGRLRRVRKRLWQRRPCRIHCDPLPFDGGLHALARGRNADESGILR